VVVLTGYGSIATALEAIRLGARHYLTKPADVDEILAAFDRERSGSPREPSPVPSLARVEWEHINRVLADCGGNISEAARVLGIHRRSLQRKLAKFPAPR
jgi:two-component system response regulator RegA